jgi:hypothetical protein
MNPKQRPAVLLFVAQLLWATATGVSAQDAPDVDPMARHFLKEMSETLANISELSFKVESTIDVVDSLGLMVQKDESLHVMLRRPNRLAVRLHTDGRRRGLTYNGKMASIYHIDYQVYSSAAVPSTIDKALDRIDEEYGFMLPLREFMSSDPYEILFAEVTEGAYLGLTEVDGVPVHHLVFRQDDVDWQIWIEDSAWHLPRKFIVTYKGEKGWPQYTAHFSDWNRRASLPDAVFEFRPPDIARKIRFLKDGPEVNQ